VRSSPTHKIKSLSGWRARALRTVAPAMQHEDKLAVIAQEAMGWEY
jgi:hypothetical protein